MLANGTKAANIYDAPTRRRRAEGGHDFRPERVPSGEGKTLGVDAIQVGGQLADPAAGRAGVGAA
ncbi:MAG: hypothetical protein JWM82_372, partial [Myxococcales bacterium]|nr:hypothetical protein [Myxococcales bacterium]